MIGVGERGQDSKNVVWEFEGGRGWLVVGWKKEIEIEMKISDGM